MPSRPQPVDLLEFVGERGRQYVLPVAEEPEATEPVDLVEAPAPSAPTSDRPRRVRRAEARAQTRAANRAAARAEHLVRAGIVVDPAPRGAADHRDLAGDPETRYVEPIASAASGRQRAWLICVLVLALGLPALVVTYGYNRGEPAEALVAAPATTASSIHDTTSESLATTESTAKATTSTAAVEETTTSSTEAPTTSTTAYATTSTTAYATTSTTAYSYAAVQAQAAPVATAPPTTAAPTTTVYVAPPTTAAPAQGEAAFLACVRMRESGGNYGAVSRDGLYRGAYQFHQATWNNVASMAGRPDLVGVPPNLAGPADQDLLAVTLYRAARCGAVGRVLRLTATRSTTGRVAGVRRHRRS